MTRQRGKSLRTLESLIGVHLFHVTKQQEEHVVEELAACQSLLESACCSSPGVFAEELLKGDALTHDTKVLPGALLCRGICGTSDAIGECCRLSAEQHLNRAADMGCFLCVAFLNSPAKSAGAQQQTLEGVHRVRHKY
jgi:hypothetical protein